MPGRKVQLKAVKLHEQGDVVGTYQQGSFSARDITTTFPKLILNFTKKTT